MPALLTTKLKVSGPKVKSIRPTGAVELDNYGLHGILYQVFLTDINLADKNLPAKVVNVLCHHLRLWGIPACWHDIIYACTRQSLQHSLNKTTRLKTCFLPIHYSTVEILVSPLVPTPLIQTWRAHGGIAGIDVWLG